MWNYLSKRLEGVARLVVCELITFTLFMLKEQITQRHLIGWRVIITVELVNNFSGKMYVTKYLEHRSISKTYVLNEKILLPYPQTTFA
jgi:hypothetical protein